MKPKTPTSNSFLSKLNRGLVTWETWMFYGASVFIFGMMVLTSIDITVRRLAGFSIEGLFELIELMLVVAVYMAVTRVQFQEKHVRVEMFVTRFSFKTQQAIEALTLILALAFFSVAIYMTGRQAWQSFLIREATFLPAAWPVWLARIILTIGIFFLALRLLIQIGQRIGHVFGKCEEPSKKSEEAEGIL